MIKRLIFDLDNTLIMWKKEYGNNANVALERINFQGDIQKTSDRINELIEEYEAGLIKHYDKKELLEFINEKLNIELPLQFMEYLTNNNIDAPDKLENETYETLEYLYKKYELVILSTWFIDAQKRRMEKAGILKYFKEFYGEENVKPHKQAFIDAIGDYQPDECALIGDSLDLDIIPAKKNGINKVVWKDNYNKREEYKDKLYGIDIITKVSDLKNIF